MSTAVSFDKCPVQDLALGGRSGDGAWPIPLLLSGSVPVLFLSDTGSSLRVVSGFPDGAVEGANTYLRLEATGRLLDFLKELDDEGPRLVCR